MIQNEPGFADLVDDNNAQRMRARIEHRRRMGRMHLAAGSTAAARSLPSGPAPSWAGIALSVALLAVLAAALTVGLSGWLVVSLLIRMGKFAKEASR